MQSPSFKSQNCIQSRPERVHRVAPLSEKHIQKPLIKQNLTFLNAEFIDFLSFLIRNSSDFIIFDTKFYHLIAAIVGAYCVQTPSFLIENHRF